MATLTAVETINENGKRQRRTNSMDCLRPDKAYVGPIPGPRKQFLVPSQNATEIEVNGAISAALWQVTGSDHTNGLTKEQEQLIDAPYRYLASNPGKDFRRRLLEACNVWLDVSAHDFQIIYETISMLHNASLLIDDIQDGSDLRRGAASAHILYGVAQTINSANYAYFMAEKNLAGLPEICKSIFNEELLNLHRGQGMDLYWRETLTVPTMSEYFQMISNKTGGLLRLAGRLMMCCARSKNKPNILPLLAILGIYYQVADDYRNLTDTSMAAAKGFAEDLTEGKFSLPIIHGISNSTNKNDLLWTVLRLKPRDFTMKKAAVDHMANVTGSLKFTKDVLDGLRKELEYQLRALGPNPPLEQLIKALASIK